MHLGVLLLRGLVNRKTEMREEMSNGFDIPLTCGGHELSERGGEQPVEPLRLGRGERGQRLGAFL